MGPLVRCSSRNAVLFFTVTPQRTDPTAQPMVDPHSGGLCHGASLSCQRLLSSLNKEYTSVGLHPCPSEPKFYKNRVFNLFSATSSMPKISPGIESMSDGYWMNKWLMSTWHNITDYSASISALGHQGWDTQWWKGLLGPCFFSFQTKETLPMCHIYPSKHPSHGKKICFLALTSFRLQQIAFGCQQLGAWAEQLEGGVHDPEGWKEKTLSPNRLVRI